MNKVISALFFFLHHRNFLLESNPLELLEDLKKIQVPRHVWEFIYYSTPFYIKEHLGLNRQSPVKNYDTIIFSRDPGFAANDYVEMSRKHLLKWEKENHAVVGMSIAFAGRTQDTESIGLLGEILDRGPYNLKHAAILTLALIGTSEAMNLLVDSILNVILMIN